MDETDRSTEAQATDMEEIQPPASTKATRKECCKMKVTCQECGKVFRGGPKARFCPECRIKHQKEAARRSAKERDLSALGVEAKRKAREDKNNEHI